MLASDRALSVVIGQLEVARECTCAAASLTVIVSITESSLLPATSSHAIVKIRHNMCRFMVFFM